MPSVRLHPPVASRRDAQNHISNPLPQLLQTPSGLAILELQGTINLPPLVGDDADWINSDSNRDDDSTFETPIGKLMFPDYSPLNPDDTKWMKRIYLYIGKYQRMTGEVKKLAKPLAAIQRRQGRREFGLSRDQSVQVMEESDNGDQGLKGESSESDIDELDIVEIIKFKIIFSSRPEPVGIE
jgi:chromosome transmission fidelity protein 8